MTLTTHAATGILVTQWTNSLLLGFLIALISHYVLDAVPHGDEWIYWRHVHNRKDITATIVGSTDTLIMCLMLFLVFEFREGVNGALVAVATVGAIGPDLLITAHTVNRDKFKKKYAQKETLTKWWHAFLLKHYTFHMFCHNMMHTPIRYRAAVAYQSVFLFCFVYFYALA